MENKFSKKMEAKAAIGLSITTYEISGTANPVITHTFWGKDLKEAVGYAKSHLLTDWFFSSSFEGEMPWKDGVIEMTNEGSLIQSRPFATKEDLENALADIAERAEFVHSGQEALGLPELVEQLS